MSRGGWRLLARLVWPSSGVVRPSRPKPRFVLQKSCSSGAEMEPKCHPSQRVHFPPLVPLPLPPLPLPLLCRRCLCFCLCLSFCLCFCRRLRSHYHIRRMQPEIAHRPRPHASTPRRRVGSSWTLNSRRGPRKPISPLTFPVKPHISTTISAVNIGPAWLQSATDFAAGRSSLPPVDPQLTELGVFGDALKSTLTFSLT